jgi:hypothetical protein
LTCSIIINVKAPLLQVHVFTIVVALLLLFYTLNDLNVINTTSAQAPTHSISSVLNGSNTRSPSTLIVSLQTDSVHYVIGTPIRVSGEVINTTSLVRESDEVIINTQESQSNVIVNSVTALAKNGFYNTSLPPISVAGKYKISAFVHGYPSSLVSIEIQELFYTRTAIMLYVGVGGSLIGLIFVILKAPRGQTQAVLRFVFLSSIALTTMMALALTDVQIAPLSPLGLVIKASSNNTQTQWVLNIGGVTTNNYSAGVQVPVSVIIFGIAGGYLRFLYFTSTKEREEKLQDEPFHESLKDLALFFLSPLLAVAVWLVLFQGGTTSNFTLAAVSFTIGLVTREVVEALTKFVISKVSPQPSDAIHGNGQKQGPTNTEEGKSIKG